MTTRDDPIAKLTHPGPPQLVFAGGGTGGHIYPALAIAEAARDLDPGAAAHILCSERPVDRDILAALKPAEAVAFTPIPANPPSLSPARFYRFINTWSGARNTATRVLRDHTSRGPTILVAMGGFVAAPAVAAAKLAEIPVVLVNLDAVPGKSNRWAAKRAAAIYSACETKQGWTDVGPIVRPALTNPIERATARRRFDLDADTNTLLITGGSQGAKTINELVTKLLTDHPGAFAGWQAIHQTGAQHDPAPVRAAYERAGIRAWADHYIADMPAAWHAADLALGRAGAGTVAEAWATRTPTVFFPYPYHKDDHQTHNARPLTHDGAAIVLDDKIDPEANARAHASTLLALLTDPARLTALAEPAHRLPPVDGAARVARAVLDRLA